MSGVGNLAIGKTTMTVTGVSWEETEEQVTEELHPFPVAAFLSHEREQCSATSGVIDTISPKIITVLTRYRPIVLELI